MFVKLRLPEPLELSVHQDTMHEHTVSSAKEISITITHYMQASAC